MEKILVFGHKKPDTDSVTSSIALSYLKNKLGFNTIPMVLGDINNETQFVLNYFNVEVPKYLNDVKLQIKDINYRKNFFLNYKQSIYEAYLYMIKNQISTLPITNEEQKLLGIISMKDIAHHQFDDGSYQLFTSYQNSN
ncbi:MAG: CBS domain-containing protein [Mollicutes bacterium]|nr:CBS domain-containing protein [Mollicutes bacterium]